jgi:hypothetical protein
MARLLKQPSSITVYCLLTKENKFPFSVLFAENKQKFAISILLAANKRKLLFSFSSVFRLQNL